MGHKVVETAFGYPVCNVQLPRAYLHGHVVMEAEEASNCKLGHDEVEFIAGRDSFYMTSLIQTHWPNVQYWNGPAGFLRVIDERTLGFAEFDDNSKYGHVGDFHNNDHVALFFVDYPNRPRLKITGRVRTVAPKERELLGQVEVNDNRGDTIRGYLVHIESIDWDCHQQIPPRFMESQIGELIAPPPKGKSAFKASAAFYHRPVKQGDGHLELVISGVRQLTPRIRAYELRDSDGNDLPTVQAGSHLRIPVQLESGENVYRHYSICSNPARRDIYEIAVLCEGEGESSSKAVHALFELGMHLHCSMAENNFSLHLDARPAVLIAGGIGVTAIKPMAQVLKARGNAVHLHYAGRNEGEMAFRDRLLREFEDAISIYRSSEGQRMNMASILSSAPKDAVFYVCGPNSLMESVSAAVRSLNIDEGRVFSQRF